MKTNAAGVELIKRNEALRLDAYLCPAGVPTIGYGHTEDVKLGQRITEHQADVILLSDLERFERGVLQLADGAPLNENQFAALVSFAFNVGLTALERSRLLRYVRAGREFPRSAWTARAADEFRLWVYAKGVKLPGLVKRREEERALFLRPV